MKTSAPRKRGEVPEKVQNAGKAETEELIVLVMEADLMVREARATIESNNRMAQMALAHLGDGVRPSSKEDDLAKARKKAGHEPFWTDKGSFHRSREECENKYLESTVEFLHLMALQDGNFNNYHSQYKLNGVQVMINTEQLHMFLGELDDKLYENFRAKWEDPDFLDDVSIYRNFFASKHLVKKRLLTNRELLIKKGLDLALRQAEKNKFGWKSDSE
jgi:hypothetical protein